MKVIKDKWFYYQLCSGIIIIVALLTVYLYHMITKIWLRNIDSLFSPVLFQGQFFSFFTYQSNFLLGIWFIASACTFHKRQYWWKNQYTRIAITLYITVTCITFMAFLLPAMLMAEKFYFSKILVGLFFHLVTPILMIVYLFMHREKNNIN
ncbi:hypothetical protein [Spiroplasma endosymbiont of Stenodema calcarata]|uniref:hypothetical protein n=1 Tax=Spiroplasma endosymbiont of Stenodema calcarata TaxID=3139328 RepID=UPI003CCAFA6A